MDMETQLFPKFSNTGKYTKVLMTFIQKVKLTQKLTWEDNVDWLRHATLSSDHDGGVSITTEYVYPIISTFFETFNLDFIVINILVVCQ